ncbi:MAG TPA: amino acid adenylation domain-containing protein [Herpetosiphonaceae bacterium]
MRTYLHDRVPAYMVPGAFVVLPALPLTPNGKLDRDALPAPGAIPTPDPPVAPRTPVEQTLAAIWTAVLGLPQVGIHDNFFALGGDSILSLQIVVRARQAAVHLTPRQLFEHPTIADLATVANTTTAVTAEQGLVVGDVPLTPIQRRFFDQQRAPQHWNEAILLSVTQPLAVDTLRDAVVCLLRHHDALRLRYARLDQGWQQMIVDDVSPPLTVLDLCELAADEQQRALQAEVQRAHQSLDLVNGPLLRLVYAQYAPPQRARLLLVIHHLAVDGVSWRVLLDDLQTAYLYLAQGQAVRLPRKTTSFQHWARRLQAYAQTDAIRAERAFWTDPAWAEAAALPRDHDLGPNTVAASEYLSVALSAAETHALLHQVPRTYRTQINDVLLTALAQALTGWTARNTVLIELEGHGRDELFEDVDLSRTVGWLTSFYPVRLQLEPGMEPGPALKTIKEQLRAIPRHGLGYGLLRYLRGDTALAAPPQAELSFNYLGQLDHVLTGDGLFQLAPESPGMPLSPAAHRSHLLDVVARTTGGQLQILWFYSANTHRRETIRGLADSCVSALRALIAHCQQPHVGGYTPSDFPLARLTQHELDQVVGADRQVERVYPLTPLQQGLLFHALYAPQSGAYIVQVGLRFTGTLDVSALQRAWQQVVAHHAILRTAFLWGRVATPHQVVRCQLDVPFTIRDWRAATGDEQQRQLDAWRAADRAAGFDLTSAPLLRVHLFWLDDTTWECVWTHHHLILDGWSLPLVLRDLLTCYAAACEEHPPRLDRPRPYEDYLAWLQEQDQSAAEAYWRTALAGIAAPTPLGIDRPVGVGHTPTYAERTVQMPSATTQALQRLARQEHLTLNTVMQAAWALLLSRYSGSADVVFGTVVAGRPADVPGVEQMVGMFINTLPRRVRLPPTMTLRHWLATLQREQAELRRYEYSALPQVQAWSAIPPGTPLFESLFVFENYPLVGLHAASQALRAVAPLQVEQLPVVQQAHYPLSLLVIPAAQLTLQCSFDQNRVTPAVAQRLLGHLQVVLDALLTDLDQPLAQVPLLTDREREQMLVAWNATQAEYPRHVCMHDVFTAQAEQTPDAPALIAGDGQMTYGELNRRANQLAWYLRARGVSAEARVAICLDRSPEMIVGLLGVLKAGGCYVPLDPAYPAERLHAILQEAQVCVLLTTQRLVARLPSHTAPVVRLDLDWMAIARERSDTLTSGVQPDHLAYVIYTSGSTGQPKGVMIAHRGLCNLATAQIRAFGVTSESRVLQFASLGFDASVSEIWMALLAGATLCLGPRDTPSSGVAALDLLREQAISIATLPPSLLAVLSPADFPALRTVIAAGETCPAHVVERWATPGRCFFNAYGPTEASVCATIAACHASADQPPIGHAIANAQVYVLDKNLQPLPVSVIGEVYIGGVGLARGYDRRVDLTAVTFIPDPFGRTPGARLYRTGDLARLREDGALDFIGRIDRQVKLRGYRIEPGEIEAMLQQHPAVCAAAVVVRGDTLVAYVVGEQRGDGPERASGTREARTVQRGIWHTELQAFLRERLPAYMIPDSVVPLDTLPLTLHGKVDRGHLLARSPERLVLERHVVAPRTEVEETIARIWTSALHLDRVSIHDNFFDLGGSSLLAIHIHTELCQTFNNHISLVEMFRHPTISGLSRYFSQDQAPPESSEHGYEPDQRTRQRIEALNSREKRRKDQV